jgi:hypothetical protein
MPTIRPLVRSSAFLRRSDTQPEEKFVHSRLAPLSARLFGGRTMLMTTVIPTRRAPSPEIRARDTLDDGAANGSAGVNRAPDVDAGVNSAPDLGEHRCRDRDDRGDSANYRKLAEHKLGLSWLPLPLPFKWPTLIN